MLSGEDIAKAKQRVVYQTPHDIFHEHDDCIRICHEWLSAQTLTINKHGQGVVGFRSLIIHWAGRYVSRDDVMVAATFIPKLHLDVHCSNLSRKLVLPRDQRLDGVGEAMRHPDQRYRLKEDLRRRLYVIFE